MRKLVGIGMGAFVWLLVGSAVAVAQQPPQDVYGGQGGAPQSDVAASGTAGLAGLPFTGLDLAWILTAGVVLVAAGFVMRKTAPVRSR
ncbi:MAG: hypothetical protein H0T20_02125 [Actinobacteria bacterium]|nr:hypothetical protein [Actinomycetota bacterium]